MSKEASVWLNFLRKRLRDRLILPGAGVALWIDPKLAALQHLGGIGFLGRGAVRAAGAAQHDLDVLHQQPLRERLPYVGHLKKNATSVNLCESDL
jgi:hypothetical protein